MTSLINDPEEALEARAPRRPIDALGERLGSPFFNVSHRFGDLVIQTPMGRSPRLIVSRYYWDTEPPTVVDFQREMTRRQAEIPVKRAYFKQRGIRYLLLADEWDVDGLRTAESSTTVQAEGDKPLSAPRQRR